VRGQLLVKRDDLTGFAAAGNKARQLELLLGEAVTRSADVLVTGGAPSSNFIQAAAAAAVYAGMRCVLVLAGRPADGPVHPNLAAATAWGAQLRWSGGSARSEVDLLLPAVAAELAASGAHPYLIPRGGACATGAAGYRLAIDELVGQLDGLAPTIVVATGSGGTLAGLIAGAVAHQRPFRVIGASVSRPAAEVASRVLELAREVAERHAEPLPEEADVHVIDARGAGHGIASAPGDAAASLALRFAGLVLDPVYTAKALAALPDLVGDEPVVFWHTGGLLDAVAGLLRPGP
jgi:D-cysteine desulfhydrase